MSKPESCRKTRCSFVGPLIVFPDRTECDAPVQRGTDRCSSHQRECTVCGRKDRGNACQTCKAWVRWFIKHWLRLSDQPARAEYRRCLPLVASPTGQWPRVPLIVTGSDVSWARPPGATAVAAFDDSLIGLFRINSPTIALFFEMGGHVARTLPVGSIVEALDAQIGEKGLLDIIWEGKKALMFAIDLKSRSKKVADPGV
jgi:hypothetical protein